MGRMAGAAVALHVCSFAAKQGGEARQGKEAPDPLRGASGQCVSFAADPPFPARDHCPLAHLGSSIQTRVAAATLAPAQLPGGRGDHPRIDHGSGHD